ncbi:MULTISPECIES: zeta toxin family protein [unclassified Pseudomonas]|uniref:zeta toxin family protein n=1 Tax=unclassified Pseudomonas TaxID=196821 RepID=UPI0025D76E94|nr:MULTISPECIES: zeta toxin family protein [unclassified Pseudomonas]
MTSAPNYHYTQTDINQAYAQIAPGIFDAIAEPSDGGKTPKLLVVAGAQGAGKTYLLENTLLPSGHYSDFIRPYIPEYRARHPQYEQMLEHGVLHAYAHTEQFIWDLGRKIFQDAFANKYNIIIETALDSIEFASLPMYAASKGYQFEVHLIGCKREFAHVSTIERALKSIESKELERFVSLENIDASMANAQSILTAFENACAASVGSTITLYERGFGVLRDRRVVCRSLCTQSSELIPQSITDENGVVIEPRHHAMRILRTAEANKPCAFNNYARLVNAPIVSLDERGETLKAAHLALANSERCTEPVPYQVFNDLHAYIVKYVFR